MFVRVFDKERCLYFKSIVYGIINIGYDEKHIVLHPYIDGGCFTLIDHIDYSNKDYSSNILINTIDPNTENWVQKKKYECKRIGLATELFYGYEDVFNDKENLKGLTEGVPTPQNQVNFTLRTPDDSWEHIFDQQDADQLLKLFFGFHDSYMVSYQYKGEHELDHVGKIVGAGKRRQLNMVFYSSWFGTIELCFEGLLASNLRPASDNFSDELYWASLNVKEETIFFADTDLEDENLNYGGDFVKAFHLKWRVLNKLNETER